MGLYKLTNDTAFIGCPNGHSFSVLISECRIGGESIALPKCTECEKKIHLLCAVVDKDDGNYKKHRLNQTLGKRLVDLEKTFSMPNEAFTIRPEVLAHAIEWSDDINESVPSKYLEE